MKRSTTTIAVFLLGLILLTPYKISAEVTGAAVGGPANPRPENQTQLKIEYPQEHSIFQRSGNTGEIIIEGVLTGTPGPVEARFNNGLWTSVCEGAKPGKFTATLMGTVGQGTLEVRLKQSPEVTASVPMVSIGDIFDVAGQSNAAGWAGHAYEPLDDLPYEMSLYKRNVSTAWETLRHPASASGKGSPWPITMSHLCKDHQTPIGLITTAIGGAWLKQWQKPSGNHYPGMVETVRAATRGSMKVRALLWFQGEADCSPLQKFAHLSYNGDHDQYLAALEQFVSDVHHDMKLETVYIGSIGNVPHTIGSTRENIFGIRRALQSSWSNPQISPGPVTYDIALDADPIHFNAPEEMIPLAKRWAAAISSGTYKTGVGRGPILQKAERGQDERTVVLTFDKELKISDFKGRPGTKAEGWSCQQDGATLGDADIVSTTVEKSVVSIRFNTPVTRTLRLSYGIDHDGAGKNILRGVTDLPVEPFYKASLTIYGDKGFFPEVKVIDTAEMISPKFQSLFYKPTSKITGNMWDSWVFLQEGVYYLYYLAGPTGWNNISMARSHDGVHWQEIGPVLVAGKGVTWMGTGSTWKSPRFADDGKFYMNFSEWKGERQNIYFAESKDLIHWTRLGEGYKFTQDERWYQKNGRWDCIWAIDRPGGGKFGYWTANSTTGGEFGFGESDDGVHWKALPAPKVIDAGSAGGREHGEVGAVEKIGDKYYMMFGHYPFMVALVADQPAGPFRGVKKNYRIISGNTYFSRFLVTPETVLINHHATSELHSIFKEGAKSARRVHFSPFKKAMVDSEGTLRLGWWEGNDKYKHVSCAVAMPKKSESKKSIAMLESAFDTDRGIVLEGDIKIPSKKDASGIGLYIGCKGEGGSALLMRYGGVCEVGSMLSDGSGFKPAYTVDREWKFSKVSKFRLLLKGGLLEFYVDDILMQSYSLKTKSTGKIGLIQGGHTGSVSNLKAWYVSEDK